MKYKLVYTQRAVKDIQRLDSVAKKRLKKALEQLATNPLTYSSKLINPKIGQYRFRVGDHRIIFDLKGKEIIILRVGHRRDIYR